MAPKKKKATSGGSKVPSMLARENKKKAAAASAAKPAPKAATKGFGKVNGKAGAAAKSPPAKPAAPKWTPEDTAARSIQRIMRGKLAQKSVAEKKEQHAKWEAEMEELENEAWLAELAYEKRQEEKRRKKEEEEQAKRKKAIKLRTQLLEGAFDGDLNEMNAALAEGCPVDAADANDNTALSEAAAGGQLEACKLLVEHDCDPNTQGHFKRTPLWRACFAGHSPVVQYLLTIGADPRIGDIEGGVPRSIATVPAIKQILEEWDVTQTDALLQGIAAKQDQKRAAFEEEINLKKAGLQSRFDEAKEAHDTAQTKLRSAYAKWNQRILEYDTCISEGKGGMDIMDAVKQTIVEAEEHLEEMKEEAAEAADAFNALKGDLMSFQQENAPEEVLPGVKITMKVLNDVLFKDIGGNRAKDGRWPLVIDPSKRATMFVRYRDTNYLNACSTKDMSMQIIRKAVLGSLRYGKALCVDMMDVDMMEAVVSSFDQVQKGLYESIMSRELLKNENYMSLVDVKEDGPEYHHSNFQDDRVKDFVFVLITYSRRPADELMERFYCIHVKADTDGD